MGGQLSVYDVALADRRLVSQFNGNRHDRDLKWAAEKQYALSIIASNEALQEADPDSLRMALMDVAFSGLSLAPTKHHAYLIPYKRQVQFSPGYRGLLYLVQKADTIKSVQPGLVRQNDRFRYYLRDNRMVVEHEPATKNPGPLTHVYVIAEFTNGGQHVEVMNQADIEACKKAATQRNAKGGAVWRSAFESQMWIKSCIRRAWKYWPHDKAGALDHAMETVNKAEPVDFAPAPDAEPPDAEVCITSDQALELHAFLTDRDVPKSGEWIANLAKALGLAAIEQLPERRFSEAKQRLSDRYERWAAARGAK